jgi:hypothetical protein
VAGEDGFGVELHGGEVVAAQGVYFAGGRVAGDVDVAGSWSVDGVVRRVGGVGVVEADVFGVAEEVDLPLEALVGGGARGQGQAEVVREDLVAETYGEERTALFEERGDVRVRVPDAGVMAVARVAGAGSQDDEVVVVEGVWLVVAAEGHQQAQGAELVGDHGGEGVFHVDDQGGAARETGPWPRGRVGRIERVCAGGEPEAGQGLVALSQSGVHPGMRCQ